MINANELRIGNWVKNLGLDVKIEGYGIAFCAEGKLIYEPIPLTPEMLEACGFEKSDVYTNQYQFCTEYLIDRQDGSFGFLVGDDQSEISSFKYLHQLQNLYFALTGEEIEIKL